LVKSHTAAAIRRAMAAEDDATLTDDVAVPRLQPKFAQQRDHVKANPAYIEVYVRNFFDTGNTIPLRLFIPKDGPERVEQQRK